MRRFPPVLPFLAWVLLPACDPSPPMAPGSGDGGAGGGSWSAPVALSGAEHGAVAAVALAVDGRGDGLSLFVAGGASWGVRLPAGGEPAVPARIDAAGVGGGPSLLALGSGGDGLAFWRGEGGGIDGAEYHPGSGFGAPETYLGGLDRLSLAALDVDPEGDAVVGFAYYDATHARWNLGHSIRDAGVAEWRPAADWAIQRVSKSTLAIARLDPDLSVIAAWVDHLGRPWASAIDIDRRSGRLAQTSGYPLDLDATGTAEDLRVAFDGAAHGYAAWRWAAEDGERVAVAVRNPDRSWGEAASLGPGAPGRPPVLAAPRDGAGAAVAFVAPDGTLQVARYDGTRWETDRLPDSRPGDGEVSLAFSARVGWHVAYVEGPALRVVSRSAGGWGAPETVDTGAVTAPVLRAGADAIRLAWLRTAPDGATGAFAAVRR
jgi:hypothetical protein